MNSFTIRELRKNLKSVLDLADKGEEVVIYRRDKVYILKVPFNPQNYECIKTSKEIGYAPFKGTPV